MRNDVHALAEKLLTLYYTKQLDTAYSLIRHIVPPGHDAQGFTFRVCCFAHVTFWEHLSLDNPAVLDRMVQSIIKSGVPQHEAHDKPGRN